LAAASLGDVSSQAGLNLNPLQDSNGKFGNSQDSILELSV